MKLEENLSLQRKQLILKVRKRSCDKTTEMFYHVYFYCKLDFTNAFQALKCFLSKESIEGKSLTQKYCNTAAAAAYQ